MEGVPTDRPCARRHPGTIVLCWLVLACALMGGVAALVDGAIVLLSARPSLQTLLGVMAIAAAAGVLAAPAFALPAGIGGMLRRRLFPRRYVHRTSGTAGGDDASSPWRAHGATMAPAAALAFAWGFVVTDPLSRGVAPVYLLVLVLAAAAVAVSVGLSEHRPRRQARTAAALLAALVAALDVWLAPSMYPEFHDLGLMVFGAALLSAASDARGVLERLGPGRLTAILVLMLSGALWLAARIDTLFPDARFVAVSTGRHGTALGRVAQRLVDLDRDGFSPILSGGDCDDLDPGIHPLASDPPGGRDRNCNGARLSGQEDRDEVAGLAPPPGDAARPDDGAQLVVLIIIDTLRVDAFTPELLPASMAQLADALHFDRAYAAGANTAMTLDQIFGRRGQPGQLAPTLRAQGVETTAAVGVRWLAVGDYAFGRLTPASDAAGVTDAALDEIQRQTAHSRLLWVHYGEPHAPWPARPGVRTPAGPSHLPQGYRTAIAYLDGHLHRLLSGLREGPDWPRTTVIITSDHGEGLGEHGIHGHGRSGYEPMIAVPAAMLAPELPAGRYRHLVSHLDLPATIYGALGLETLTTDAERFGRSWLRLRGQTTARLHDFVVTRSRRFSSGRAGSVDMLVLTTPQYKLVASLQDGLSTLFDPLRDPQERRTISASHRHDLEALKTKLARYVDMRDPATIF